MDKELTITVLGIAGTVIGTLTAAYAPKFATQYELDQFRRNNPGINASSQEAISQLKNQKDIRIRNLACIGEKQRWFNAGQMSLSGVFCPDTGDIRVQYRLSQAGKEYEHWIENEDRQADSSTANLFLLSPANASLLHLTRTQGIMSTDLISSSDKPGFRAIFQRQASDNQTVRVIQQAGNQCSRQLINSYTGEVTGRPIGACSERYHLGYCSILPAPGRGNKVINDKCLVGKTGSNQIVLVLSPGRIIRISLTPVTVDGMPGRLIQKGSNFGTIKTTQGNLGWCWHCIPN